MTCTRNGDTAVTSSAYRCRVPGGWLVQIVFGAHSETGTGLTFYPDPDHVWDGNSLP